MLATDTRWRARSCSQKKERGAEKRHLCTSVPMHDVTMGLLSCAELSFSRRPLSFIYERREAERERGGERFERRRPFAVHSFSRLGAFSPNTIHLSLATSGLSSSGYLGAKITAGCWVRRVFALVMSLFYNIVIGVDVLRKIQLICL